MISMISMISMIAGVAGATAVTAVTAAPSIGAVAPGVLAVSDDDAAGRAAREILEGRQRANALADELWAAQSDLEVLRVEQVELEAQIDALTEEVERLGAVLEAVAVSRFVSAGTGGIPVLSDLITPNERVLTDFYADVIHEIGASDRDDHRRMVLDLEHARVALGRNAESQQSLINVLDTLRREAEADVARLRELERERLEDEAVQRAFEAQRREQERRDRDQQERQARAGVDPVDSPAGVTSAGAGSGSRPQSAGFVDQMICPVRGASAYSDTWGAPRSGGRRHQGVDMLAPTGTILQAVVSGHVGHHNLSLGGLSVILRGDNGNRYFYAHLSAFEGQPGYYQQGDVIGYVGDTGNAYGTPHLHFEIRPGGGPQVNPTPSVRAAGC
jgi:murein DD-endopeptidase MepM/ murein hydrolase activator NlpD